MITDNAGCYSGDVCGESYLMARLLRIKVVRHDHNEPQRGNDQSDQVVYQDIFM